jgi:hypothetical protein
VWAFTRPESHPWLTGRQQLANMNESQVTPMMFFLVPPEVNR